MDERAYSWWGIQGRQTGMTSQRKQKLPELVILFKFREGVKTFKMLIVGMILTFLSITGHVINGDHIGYKEHFVFQGVDYVALSTSTLNSIQVDRNLDLPTRSADYLMTYPRSLTRRVI